MRGKAMLAATVAVAVAAAGLAGYALGRGGERLGADPAPPGAQDGPPPGDGVVLASALRPFDDCEDLLAYYRDEALERVGPYGLEGEGGGRPAIAQAEGRTSGGALTYDEEAALAPAAGDAAVGAGPTGTNVQEEGVDEPDLVKTDGRRAVAVANGRLQVVDLGAGEPRISASVDLPDGAGELLLDGDRVLVLSRGAGEVIPLGLTARSVPAWPSTSSTLTLVDIGDPGAPTVVGTVQLDGDYRSARLADGTARIVIDTAPTGLPFTTPSTGGLRAEREASERNREVVRDATLEDWLPWSVVTDAGGRTVQEGPLLDCTQVRRPPAFAGLSTLSVLSLDLAGDLELGGATGVVARGETVYASRDTLYVATTAWDPDGAATTTTDLHAFDLSDPRRAPYRASGRVDGRLLNQYSLSEHDGHLRVAVTEDGGGAGPSQSAVVVLATDGNELREVGRAGGLGPTETIQSVRFLGELGVVVTFRQTDPLYTLDLSDPADPRVTGELKIPGFSAYLHPVGGGRLLGVGQDATEDGSVTGVQVSLFDVRDPAAPARLDQVAYGQGFAAVQADPRAFLFRPEDGLVVVPVELYGDHGSLARSSPAGGFSGAVALRVTAEGVQEAGRLPAPAGPGTGIQRVFAASGVLYTVSDAAIGAAGLDDLAPLGHATFDE